MSEAIFEVGRRQTALESTGDTVHEGVTDDVYWTVRLDQSVEQVSITVGVTRSDGLWRVIRYSGQQPDDSTLDIGQSIKSRRQGADTRELNIWTGAAALSLETECRSGRTQRATPTIVSRDHNFSLFLVQLPPEEDLSLVTVYGASGHVLQTENELTAHNRTMEKVRQKSLGRQG